MKILGLLIVMYFMIKIIMFLQQFGMDRWMDFLIYLGFLLCHMLSFQFSYYWIYHIIHTKFTGAWCA